MHSHYKSHTYIAEKKKPLIKTLLDTTFPKDGYICPKNSIVSISTCYDTLVNSALERGTNQDFCFKTSSCGKVNKNISLQAGNKIETNQPTTENMISCKEYDGSHKVCQCQQSDPASSEQLVTKLPQSILKEKKSIESLGKSLQVEKPGAFEQFQDIGKISVETNTEPGIHFRNTPNTAIFNVKVQETSTRTDENKTLPINNLQKTLQRQELPSINIRPELCIQSGPVIDISAKGLKNEKELRRNIDVTNIVCDEKNINPSKQGVNDIRNRLLLKNKTKQLEDAKNVKSRVKTKSETESGEDLSTKHKNFNHSVEAFITKLQKENSKMYKNQNEKLLQTLHSLSSNVNELYENFQYAIPSYQNCIMTRVDKVTQLLEYELQDDDSIMDEHRCRLDEYFQQLTKSFQQEQYRRLWQKNISMPPQDFITLKSSKCKFKCF